MENLIELKQRRFRASGIVMFSVALGLLIARIVASLMYRVGAGDTLVDVVFTCLVQIVFLGVVPFFIYKIALRESPRGIFELSNFRKPISAFCFCAFRSVCVCFALPRVRPRCGA